MPDVATAAVNLEIKQE